MKNTKTNKTAAGATAAGVMARAKKAEARLVSDLASYLLDFDPALAPAAALVVEMVEQGWPRSRAARFAAKAHLAGLLD